MKVMVIVKASADSEAGVLPDPHLLAEMGAFNEELVKAGIMLAGEGLHPSSKGVRVRFAGKDRIVTDGPFAETKELVAGFWIWRVGSMDEAIAWVKRCPSPMEGEAEIEIRPIFEPDDFAPSDPTGELREAERRLRARAEENAGATIAATATDREFRDSRTFEATREQVWDAWTRPEHLRRWMLGPGGWTMTACEVDLRPGGSWHFAWRNTCGDEMAMGGDYRDVVPPERLVSTERWGGDWPETLSTLSLSERDGRTTITQTILYPSPEARDAAIGTGMKEGMAASLDRLADLLRAPAPA